MAVFYYTYNLRRLVKKSTHYKIPGIPSCIDSILKNRHCSFQNSCVFEMGLLDFRRMMITVIKMFFQKLQLRVIN